MRLALEAGEPRGSAEEISVTFLAPREIRELNRRHLGRDLETDVLAFRLEGSGEGCWLGDLYVCPDVAAANAAELDVPPPEEALRLIVHGALHLAGFDHPEGAERYESEMFRLQEEILGRLGWRTPPESG